MDTLRFVSVIFLIPVIYGLFRTIEYSGGQASFVEIVPIFSLGVVITSMLTEYVFSISVKEIKDSINPSDIPKTEDKVIIVNVEVFFKNGRIIKQSVVPEPGSKTKEYTRHKWRTKSF